MFTAIRAIIDFILHIDQHLNFFVSEYGSLTYAILFFIIFIETWIVIMPFLPGDSMIFAAGALAANPENTFNIFLMRGLVALAAIFWDTVNYEIWNFLGKKAFTKYPRIFKPKYLEKTESFYEKYGPMTIIYARFVPIVRTFAPFIAWVWKMTYKKFISYNLIWGLVWTTLFTRAGYFFGWVPFVQKNFTVVILWIIFISIVPVAIGGIKELLKKKISS